MIPDEPTVNLKKKAKLFSLLIDFSTKSDTSDFYQKSWGQSYLGLLEKLHEKEERVLDIRVQESFSLAVSDALKIYSWGSNYNNQLGLQTDFDYGIGP